MPSWGTNRLANEAAGGGAANYNRRGGRGGAHVGLPTDAQIIFKVFCARMDHLALGVTLWGECNGAVAEANSGDRPFTNRCV